MSDLLRRPAGQAGKVQGIAPHGGVGFGLYRFAPGAGECDGKGGNR